MLMNGISTTTPILDDVERRETERSEADCSGTSSKIVAAPPPSLRPEPEFTADAKRRTFTSEYKLRILGGGRCGGRWGWNDRGSAPPRRPVFVTAFDLASRAE